MANKLWILSVIFILLAGLVSAQDFSAEGKGSVSGCLCSVVDTSIIVHNTGLVSASYHVQQSGSATANVVAAPLDFSLAPGKQQAITEVFSAPCQASSLKLNTVISNGIEEKQMVQAFSSSACGNAPKQNTGGGKSLFSNTAVKALLALPIMLIIILIVVALAIRISSRPRQPKKIAIEKPKKYKWEKMFRDEPEKAKASSPSNWKLILIILALIVLVVVFAFYTNYLFKTHVFSKFQMNSTAVNTTAHANATAINNTAVPASSFKISPIMYYILAAVVVIALLIFFWKWIVAHWMPIALIVAAVAIICLLCWLYRRFGISKMFSALQSFLVSYWIYIVSGLVILGVIIAIILAVRSEDAIEVQPPLPEKKSRRKK
jgi:hypothetical protein